MKHPFKSREKARLVPRRGRHLTGQYFSLGKNRRRSIKTSAGVKTSTCDCNIRSSSPIGLSWLVIAVTGTGPGKRRITLALGVCPPPLGCGGSALVRSWVAILCTFKDLWIKNSHLFITRHDWSRARKSHDKTTTRLYYRSLFLQPVSSVLLMTES